MAPAEESAFFPSLHACLDGYPKLLSWRTVATELSRVTSQPLEKVVLQHIQDPAAQRAIARCLDAPSATQESKSEFETLTSAINITPSSNGRYNISQIKEDAVWLSKQVEIDEVSALRLTILEWQSRPKERLLQENIVDAAQELALDGLSSSLKASFLLSPTSFVKTARPVLDTDFDSSAARHLRLLRLHVSEEQHLLQTTECLVSRAVTYGATNHAEGRTSFADSDFGVEDVGLRILKIWQLAKAWSNESKIWLTKALSYLEKKLHHLSRESGWANEQESETDLEQQWSNCNILQMISVLRMLLVVGNTSPVLAQPSIVLGWFRLMARTNFLESIHITSPLLSFAHVPYLRCLGALNSLAFLQLHQAIASLPELSSLAASSNEPSDKVSYVQDISCVEEVTHILVDAASASIDSAMLAVFAWCIILQTIRDFAISSTEIKELRQSQKAIENFGGTTQSDNDSNDGGSERRRISPQRRSSFGSDASQQATLFEDIIELVQKLEPNDDLIRLLAQTTADPTFRVVANLARLSFSQLASGHKQETLVATRSLLLDLVRSAKHFVGYSESILESLLSIVLGDDDFWEIQSHGNHREHSFNNETRFLRGDHLVTEVFEEALGRFPYESVPFIKICRALLPYQRPQGDMHDPILDTLIILPSFTSLVIEPDVPYELEGDGDNVSLRLSSPMDIMLLAFPSLKPVSRYLLSPQTFKVPEGTVGRALSDSKPIVALWDFSYSSLRLFGLILQNTLELRTDRALPTSHPLFEISMEIIGLMTTSISRLTRNSPTSQDDTHSHSTARQILEEASDSLSRNQDVVAVILDLLEGELYKQQSTTRGFDSTGLITRGLQFLSILGIMMPSRVWPFLGRSGLLGLHGTESKLTAVVVAIEIPSGEFPILLSSIHLLEVILEDAVRNAARKNPASKALQRFNQTEQESAGAGIPNNLMRQILLQYIKILMDVFQSSGTWRFSRIEQSIEISSRICAIFNRVLSICFSIDDDNEPDGKIVSNVAPSATYLVDTFLSNGANDPTLKPLLQLLVAGLQTPWATTTARLSELWRTQTTSALHLVTTLLRLNKYLGRPMSQVCHQVFNTMPVLAKLLVAHQGYYSPVVCLLEAAVIDAGSLPQPPSLLGHLGQGMAKSFLDCLSTFGKPFVNSELSTATWKLCSAIVSQRQQWLAVYILNGQTPKETMAAKDHVSNTTSPKPIISIALGKLSHIKDLQPSEAMAMLEFIALAADTSEAVALEIRNQQACKDACLKYIAEMKPPGAIKHAQSQEEICQYQIGAYIISIIALLAHRSNERRDFTTLRHIVPRLGYLTEHGVCVPPYNASLHHSLKKNFEARFSNCTLSNFKRTSFSRPLLGPHYYYDIHLADQMLRYDAAWKGRSNRGFANEFARANLNLSMVEAQVKLFQSWKTLALQLSEGLAEDQGFQKTMARIIQDCLRANLDDTLPETIFQRLATSRVDLAFTLLQRLIDVAPRRDDVKGLVDPAWAALHGQASQIASLLVGNDAAYYRTLLRMLYLSLQSHVSGDRPRSGKDLDNIEKDRSDARAKKAKEVEATVLEILQTVVAHGFRSLIVELHENPSRVQATDFVLLIAIMRTCLQIPGVASYSEQLLTYFDDERTAQHASTLLSWSDRLATAKDPIYGEVSMNFLLELSNLPVLAESLVVNGTFAQAATTNLLSMFRKSGGVGPFDEPMRLYNIWARGYLPLVINLLSSVGPPIAAELSTTLSQFEGQLSRASHSLCVKLSNTSNGPYTGYLTLTMAAEVHALALITAILNRFRESGSSLGIVAADVVELPWDSSGVREDIETRLQRRNNLRNNIIPTDEHEEAWSRQKPLTAQEGCENRLEEKVVGELRAALSLLGNADW